MTLKNKYLLIVTGALIITLLSILFLLKELKKWKENSKRWEGNYFTQVQADSTNYFKTKSGLNGTIAKEYEFSYKEVKKSSDSIINGLKKTIKDQGIKLRDVENQLSVTIQSQGQGITQIDTVIIKNDSVRHFKASDGFLTFEGNIYTDSVRWKYTNKDKLVLTEFKRKPLKPNGDKYKIPVRWFKKKETIESIVSLNPNSKPTIVNKIILNKNKKR